MQTSNLGLLCLRGTCWTCRPCLSVCLCALTVAALSPVEPWETLVALGSPGALLALAEARAVAAVVHRAQLIAVTLCKTRMKSDINPGSLH